MHLLLKDSTVVTLKQELLLIRELSFHFLADLLLQTQLLSRSLGRAIKHSLDRVSLEIGRYGFLDLTRGLFLDLAVNFEFKVSEVGFKVLYLLSQQTCFPLPKRLQVVLLYFNRHLIFFKINHRVAKDLDGCHGGSIALAVAYSCDSGVTTW